MTYRMHQLRAALERSMNRVRHCERELDRFRDYCDLTDPKQERTFFKLRSDVDRAQRDAAWFQHQLDQAMNVENLDF
jgi:hypothetical protein